MKTNGKKMRSAERGKRIEGRIAACLIVALTCLAGCQNGKGGGGLGNVLDNIGIGGNVGGVDVGRAARSVVKVGEAAGRAVEDFDAKDEYHIGRAAAAQIIHQYPLYKDEAANRYVNLVGQSLALFSKRPEVYAGYNFQILDSDEINAFACPGAFIFITRGMLRLTSTEDELAAVLAHEIGHIQGEHALKSIKNSRGSEFWATLGAEAARNAGGGAGGRLGDMVADLAGDTFKVLTVSGYSRELETEADQEAVEILRATGYDPNAMVTLLTKMDRALKPGGHDFAATHPKTKDRVEVARKQVGNVASHAAVLERVTRFNTALAAARAK